MYLLYDSRAAEEDRLEPVDAGVFLFAHTALIRAPVLGRIPRYFFFSFQFFMRSAMQEQWWFYYISSLFALTVVFFLLSWVREPGYLVKS